MCVRACCGNNAPRYRCAVPACYSHNCCMWGGVLLEKFALGVRALSGNW